MKNLRFFDEDKEHQVEIMPLNQLQDEKGDNIGKFYVDVEEDKKFLNQDKRSTNPLLQDTFLIIFLPFYYD